MEHIFYFFKYSIPRLLGFSGQNGTLKKEAILLVT